MHFKLKHQIESGSFKSNFSGLNRISKSAQIATQIPYLPITGVSPATLKSCWGPRLVKNAACGGGSGGGGRGGGGRGGSLVVDC